MSYEIITRFDSPNFTPAASVASVFGVHRAILSITVHHWGDPAGNPSFNGVINWLCNPAAQVSAHTVIEAGRIAYIVNYEDASWSTGSAQGNATTIGLELNPQARDSDYETAAEHIADIWMEYGILPIKAHKEWVATACPGRWDLGRLGKLAGDYYDKKDAERRAANGQTQKYEFHTVAKGDTMYAISRKYKVSLPQLVSYNKMAAPYTIFPGQKIRVR